MKSRSIFTHTRAICALLFILVATSGLAADEPTVTIDTIEGTGGVIKIYYTSTGKSDEKWVTTGWQYSIDDGKTWTTIDEAAIGNNDPKPPGSSGNPNWMGRRKRLRSCLHCGFQRHLLQR